MAQSEAARNPASGAVSHCEHPAMGVSPAPGTGIRVSGVPPREAEPDARSRRGTCWSSEGRPVDTKVLKPIPSPCRSGPAKLWGLASGDGDPGNNVPEAGPDIREAKR